MPNIKSAKKRVLINQKKNDENRSVKSRMNSAIKKFNSALDVNNVEEAEKLLPLTMSIIDATASKGVVHKNNAANKKSALAKRLNDIKSGKIVVTIKKDNKTVAAEKAKLAQEVREKAKAEYQRVAAEKKSAKIEAEKAKLEAEKAAKKPVKAKKDAPKDSAKDVKAEEKPKAKKEPKTEEKADAPKAKKAPAKKADADKKEND